jgi:hypothetical protein
VSFDLPSSVAFDEVGNLFISDQANQVIRRIGAADGIVKVVAGNCPDAGFGCSAGRGYSGATGPPPSADLEQSRTGHRSSGQDRLIEEHSLYIADTGNNVVRKVVAGSDGVSRGRPRRRDHRDGCGTRTPGFSGDGGPATMAELSSPTDVAIAADGTLFIADRSNSCVRRSPRRQDPRRPVNAVPSATLGGRRARPTRSSNAVRRSARRQGDLYIAGTRAISASAKSCCQ